MSSPSLALIERRTHARVAVELRCYNALERTQAVVARTVNISRRGALLAWNSAAAGGKTPELGDLLKVDVELPAGQLRRRCIYCFGRVVRVQLAEKKQPLIALAIEQMGFRDRVPAPAKVKVFNRDHTGGGQSGPQEVNSKGRGGGSRARLGKLLGEFKRARACILMPVHRPVESHVWGGDAG
jgi:hypothetical protein